MSFNLTGSDLPLVHAGLVKFTERVAYGILHTKITPELYAEKIVLIEDNMTHVYAMTDRVRERYESTVRLAQHDLRRAVELARNVEPDKTKRALLIDVHLANYKLTCFYATVGYKNSMRLIYRAIAAVAAFKIDHCETVSS